MNFAYGGHQLRPWRLLEQVAGGADCQRLENQVGILVDGDHRELGRGQAGLELPHTFDAALSW